MTPADAIESFARDLKKAAGVTRTAFASFPSGAASLDVWAGDRFFVMHYSPSHALYCVDELGPDEGIGTWYRWGFPDFLTARQKLLELMHGPSTLPACDPYGKPNDPQPIATNDGLDKPSSAFEQDRQVS